MPVRMTIHQDGIDALLEGPQVTREVGRGAKLLASTAAGLAPDGGPGRGIAESYKATPAVTEPGRVVATAYTDDFAGHLVEWGSVNNPAYAPLRRAAERIGLRTRVAPKGES